MQLITKSFREQAISFPSRVDAALADVKTLQEAKDVLDKAAALQKYAQQLKAGIEIERPIALGVLKIKAKLGELMPAKSRKESGQMKGKKGIGPDTIPFDPNTKVAYRKLAENKEKIEEYAETALPEDEVPTQAGFLKYIKGEPHVTHNSDEQEWYTPEEYLEAAREVLGAIELDPASSEVANKRVKASKYYTKTRNGLNKTWEGKVWLNPPYSKGDITAFVAKLVSEYQDGNIEEAICLVNNATETAWGQHGIQHCTAVCLHAGRIKYHRPHGDNKGTPLQGQMFLYFGDKVDEFDYHFKQFGVILCPQ